MSSLTTTPKIDREKRQSIQSIRSIEDHMYLNVLVGKTSTHCRKIGEFMAYAVLPAFSVAPLRYLNIASFFTWNAAGG